MALTFQSAEALVQIINGKEGGLDDWFPKSYRLSRVQNPRGEGKLEVLSVILDKLEYR